MKNRITPLIYFLAFTLASCGGVEQSDRSTASESLESEEELIENSASKSRDEHNSEKTGELYTDSRKLIREGSMEFPTDDIDGTRQMIMDAIDQYDGFVSQDRSSHHGDREEHQLIIRIPSQYFDAFVGDIEAGTGDIDRKNMNTKDVTMQYLDLDARINAKKELEKRYLELLSRAETVTEMLEIERQIGILREDIESMEGQFRYLKDRVSYSTITLTFYKVIPVEVPYAAIIITVLLVGGVILIIRYMNRKKNA